MTVETAERRFGFKFEEATKTKTHVQSCNCFPCRVYGQWQNWTGTYDWSQARAIVDLKKGNLETRPYTPEEIEEAKTLTKAIHDPERVQTQKLMKKSSDAFVIWNGCVFWIL